MTTFLPRIARKARPRDPRTRPTTPSPLDRLRDLVEHTPGPITTEPYVAGIPVTLTYRDGRLRHAISATGVDTTEAIRRAGLAPVELPSSAVEALGSAPIVHATLTTPRDSHVPVSVLAGADPVCADLHLIVGEVDASSDAVLDASSHHDRMIAIEDAGMRTARELIPRLASGFPISSTVRDRTRDVRRAAGEIVRRARDVDLPVAGVTVKADLDVDRERLRVSRVGAWHLDL